MRALALDLGSKRIGIALSSGTLATPYEVLARAGDRRRDHRAIAEHVAETEAEVVVVGLPLSLDGSIGHAAERVLAECDQLAEALDVPIETWDERLSTVTAERSLTEQQLRGPARRRVVDKVAAAVILQSWLDARPAEHPTEEPS
ncbi:MAG TPA: Holliday junction resolvase RuvX [Acidimicrobiales bacterium]|nr:Holliday junction resolvase RuvX [Acidimicrobiales bacterium]